MEFHQSAKDTKDECTRLATEGEGHKSSVTHQEFNCADGEIPEDQKTMDASSCTLRAEDNIDGNSSDFDSSGINREGAVEGGDERNAICSWNEEEDRPTSKTEKESQDTKYTDSGEGPEDEGIPAVTDTGSSRVLHSAPAEDDKITNDNEPSQGSLRDVRPEQALPSKAPETIRPEDEGTPDVTDTGSSGVPHSAPAEDDKITNDRKEERKPSQGSLRDVRPKQPLPSTAPETIKNPSMLMLFGLCGVVVSVLVVQLFGAHSPPEKTKFKRVDHFLQDMKRIQSAFPSQRAELWRRSRIHLERHLEMDQPTEPVSLILTSGRGAERTLGCLAHRLAAAFSSALNASVLHIDGASKAALDSDQVKLDIDRELRDAFEGDKPAAVIHRFEELPPGATLIFYRYCDHENAAYKQVFLTFTVLLEGEDVSSHMNLRAVEEMVQDHIHKKFLSSAQPTSFDRMDVDKLSGLWSRISHLILPVAAEERVEQQGCGASQDLNEHE